MGPIGPLAGGGGSGFPFATFINFGQTGNILPVFDPSQSPTGAGSMKFTQGSLSSASAAGSWFTRFADDSSIFFGAGDQFYCQWRQRFSPEMLTTMFSQSLVASGAVTGSPTITNIPTNITATGANSFTGLNKYAYFLSGTQQYKSAVIIANTGGANSVLTVRTQGPYGLSAAPAVGDTLQVIVNQGGWKQADLSKTDPATCTPSQSTTCATSCETVEIIIVNNFLRGMVQGYHACGVFADFAEAYQGDLKLQNVPSPFCLYSQAVSQGNISGCFGYFPNEWMTFRTGVNLGALGPSTGLGLPAAYIGQPSYLNSRVRLWVARPGQVMTNTMDHRIDLLCDSITTPSTYGKLWLLPYQTGKDPTQVHPACSTWYTDVEISRYPMADPVQ
jgi:hypothetical protein